MNNPKYIQVNSIKDVNSWADAGYDLVSTSSDSHGGTNYIMKTEETRAGLKICVRTPED